MMHRITQYLTKFSKDPICLEEFEAHQRSRLEKMCLKNSVLDINIFHRVQIEHLCSKEQKIYVIEVLFLLCNETYIRIKSYIYFCDFSRNL